MTDNAARAELRRSYAGPAFLSFGFRPFFLLAGIWAPVTLLVSLWMILGGEAPSVAWPAIDWHVHEMLFGYVAAAIAGFLLTAVPNWTGRLPVRGAPLLGLACLWGLGRLAMLVSGWIGLVAAAAVDLVFLVGLAVVAAREIVAGGNWRNLPIVSMIGLLVLANALFHAEVLGLVSSAGVAARFAIAVVTLLIALIGGRIVPSFTRNWLVARESQALPVPFGRFDKLSLVLTALACVVWIAAPDGPVTAVALAFAAVANGARFLRWQGHRTLREPLLFVLHLGYAWVPAGLALSAASAWSPAVPPVAGVHALTVGAMATMTLAVMSRAILGHTGRALKAPAGLTVSFVLITFAALCRMAVAVIPDGATALLALSAAAWIGAFVLFLLACGPMLFRPRTDG